MKEWSIKFNRNNILLSILMVLLGLVLFIWPGVTLVLVARILGVALLVAGVVSAISWYQDRGGYMMLAVAMVLAVLGLIVMAAPKGVVTILPRLVGIAILINGIINVAQALDQRKKGMPRWSVAMAMAVLTIIAGAFIALHAFGVLKTAVMVIGAILIYNGVSNLWIESRYRRAARR